MLWQGIYNFERVQITIKIREYHKFLSALSILNHTLMLNWDSGIKVSIFKEFPTHLGENLPSHLLQCLFNIKFVKLSLYDEIKKNREFSLTTNTTMCH